MTEHKVPDAAVALTKRYGEGSEPTIGTWNSTLSLLLSHRSVRQFRPDPLPDGVLEALIAAAQSAATSSLLQTWSVISVTDREVRKELAAIGGAQVESCPTFLVFVSDLSRIARVSQAEGATLEAVPFFESYLVAAVDAAIAAQTTVVAAESLGLSTVYSGAMRNDVIRISELLGLPDGVAPVTGLCVGYAAEGKAGEVKPRLPQATVLHHDKYNADDAHHRAAYDATMAVFSTSYEAVAGDWSKRVVARLGEVSALRGRDRLKDGLITRGYPML